MILPANAVRIGVSSTRTGGHHILRVRIVNRVLNDRNAQRIRSQDLIGDAASSCAKIPDLILRRGNSEQVVGGSGSGGMGLEADEEKGLILAVVDLGNPDGSADGAAEVVPSSPGASVGVRAAELKASFSKYSYRDPWNWLVPDLMV